MDKMDRFDNLISDKYKERFISSRDDSKLIDVDDIKRKPILKDSD